MRKSFHHTRPGTASQPLRQFIRLASDLRTITGTIGTGGAERAERRRAVKRAASAAFLGARHPTPATHTAGAFLSAPLASGRGPVVGANRLDVSGLHKQTAVPAPSSHPG